MGKNVPLNRNIGVIKRNTGMLKVSMLGRIPVKQIAMEANSSPASSEKGRIKRAEG